MSLDSRGLRPGEFAALLLRAVDASEGRTRKRKRDQRPDSIGLELRRELLARAAQDDPAPDDFEEWLLERTFEAPASGPVRAMCAQILEEYRLAQKDPSFAAWLREGAPSADADLAESGDGARPLPERW